MDLERTNQLLPHRVRATLRLDGRLVRVTSQRVFRGSATTRSWLRQLVRDLESRYERVVVERFRLLPEVPSTDETIETDAAMKRAVFVLEDGTRVKGLVEGFDPSSMRSICVREVDAQDKLIQIHDIDVLSILAAFFVEDLAMFETEASTSATESDESAPPRPGSERVNLTMVWGERIRGDLLPLDSRGLWYEFFTIDPQRAANLKRALVSRRAIARKQPLGTHST